MSYKQIIIVFLNLFIVVPILAQSPIQDLNWEAKWIDNFDSPLLGPNWIKANYGVHGNEPQLYLKSNDTVINGKLLIKTNNNSTICPTNSVITTYACSSCIPNKIYNYSSGWVETSNLKNFKYGFFETEIEMPQGNGMWPSFWTWRYNSPPNVSYTGQNEIDVFEALLSSNYPSKIGSNLFTEYCPETTTTINCESAGYLTAICPNFDPNILCYGMQYQNFNFNVAHKFGLEWNSSKIIWYIDDNIVRTTANPGINDSVRLIFNIAIDTNNLPNITNIFPTFMKINYVKYYQLKKSCQTIFNSCSFNTFDYKIYDEIRIGGLNCQNLLNTNSNYILRCINGLQVNGEFSLPLGTIFEVKLQNCIE